MSHIVKNHRPLRGRYRCRGGGRTPRLCLVIVWLLLFAARAPGGNFRFAWLTDTHVGSATGSEDLRRSVADLNARSDIAFVLLSGDITEFGSDAELREARAVLDSLRHPWRIIPGNHDTKWSESGCTAFSGIFGSTHFALRWEGILFLGVHQGPVMRMGDGHFAPEEIAWLDSVLARVPKGERLVLVTHYPLDHAVDNWYEVTRRLRQKETVAILHGHGHANRGSVQDGIPAVMARSNLRGKADRGGYTLVDVRGDSMVFAEKRPGLEELPPWHLITAADRVRAFTERSLPPPDFAVNALSGSPREVWSYTCGATVTTAPAVSGDQAFVGDFLGRVRALDLRSGRLRWEYRANSPVHSTPAVDEGRVVFGTADGRVLCLDVRDGRPVWTCAARGPVLGAPAIVGGRTYIGASDSAFRAIDLRRGTLHWEFAGLKGFVESRPLVSDGRVVFGAWDGHLYALDTSNGRLLWKWSNGSTNRGLSPAACWPVAARGRIFIVAPDRFMTALDAATGQEVWRSNRYQVREAIGASSDGMTVFVRTMRDTVVALRAGGDSLAVEWVAHAGFGYDFAPCMLVEERGEVIFGTKNGLVIALARSDGRVLWQRKVGVTVVATPVPTAGGILVSDLDGRVVMLKRHLDQ